MVLVHVGTVVVLTTGKTTTTGMLAVLSDTSLTGGNVAAADSQSQSITSSFVYFIIRPVLSYFRAAADKGRLL
jgi:UDP-N-acetylmuramate-alanine ligase